MFIINMCYWGCSAYLILSWFGFFDYKFFLGRDCVIFIYVVWLSVISDKNLVMWFIEKIISRMKVIGFSMLYVEVNIVIWIIVKKKKKRKS